MEGAEGAGADVDMEDVDEGPTSRHLPIPPSDVDASRPWVRDTNWLRSTGEHGGLSAAAWLALMLSRLSLIPRSAFYFEI